MLREEEACVAIAAATAQGFPQQSPDAPPPLPAPEPVLAEAYVASMDAAWNGEEHGIPLQAPPLPALASPPPGPQLRRVVGTGKSLLQSWMPREHESSNKRSGSTGTVALVPVKEELPTEDGTTDKVVYAVYHLARDIRRTGRCIGMLPFILYAHRRRVGVHVLLWPSIRGSPRDVCPCVGGQLPRDAPDM